jgi:hypothetical protein
MLGYDGEAVMAPRSVDVGTGMLALTCVNSFKYKCSPRGKVLNIKMGSSGEDIVRYFSALVRGRPLTYKQTFIKAAVGAVVAASSAALNRR